jgi:hypothetical protein
MASCAAGYFSGVAKSARIVAVQTGGFSDSATIYDYMKGLAFATNHVVANGMQGLAVFSMSWGMFHSETASHHVPCTTFPKQICRG